MQRSVMLIASVFSAIIAPGCNNRVAPPAGAGTNLFVLHHKTTCTGLFPTLCLVVKDGPDGDYEPHFFGIEGFTFEWGNNYELRTRVEQVLVPPQDGSSRRVILEEIMSKERVEPGTRFELCLHPDFITSVDSEGGVGSIHFGELAFTCVNDDVCAQIDAFVAKDFNEQAEVGFRYPDVPTDPVVLESITEVGSLVDGAFCHVPLPN